MSERALSETAMLSSLRDIDMPAVAAGGMAADIAVTVGLAALAALGVSAVLRLLSLHRAAPPGNGLRERLDALAAAPEDERRIALLHLLREHAPERYAEIRGTLYARNGGIDTATLEAEVARLA